MGSELEEVVDIRSGIAYLLVKWKLIVLIALIAAVLAGGFGYMKKTRQSTGTAVSYEDRVKKARAALSEADALYVEQIYSQYCFYGDRLSSWKDYMSRSLLQRTDPYDHTRVDVQYSVTSDNKDAVNAFSAALLGQKEYEEIGALLGEDPMTASLQEIVTVTNAEIIPSSNMPSDTKTQMTTELVTPVEGMYRGVIEVTYVLQDEAQADGVQKILDAAISGKCAQMEKAGTQVTVSRLGSVSTRNDAKWLLNQQQSAATPMITLQTNRSNFVKNSVDTLSEGQRGYFTLLCEESSESGKTAAPKTKKISLKKYVAAGAVGGFILALIAVYLSFVFSGRIRGEEELRDNFGLPVLQSIQIGASKGPGKADLIRSKGLDMLGAARAAQTPEKGAELLAAELGRKLAKSNYSRIYIAYDCDKENVSRAAQTLVNALGGENLAVETGNPLREEKAYHALLGSDAVILAETLGKSQKSGLKELIGVCRRNEIPILGCVTLIDPANY